MTRIQIFRRDGHTRSFTCQGHTDFSDSGSDIVCAGVSAIVINTINCLEDLLHEQMEVEADEENGGDITVNFSEDPDEKGEFLLDCMIHGLEWIEQQYGNRYLRHRITEL